MKNKKIFIASFALFSIVSILFSVSIFIASKVPDPIYINSEEDFYKINDNLDGYYVLKQSIKFEKPIRPIGDKDHPFTGHFDGGNSYYTLSNLVFDLSSLELEKYTIDNTINIGLFSINNGTIIHNTFSDIQIKSFNYQGDKVFNFGFIAGINNGKITSNRITRISNLDFDVKKELCFGSFCGRCSGEIRRNDIVGHFNIKTKSCEALILGGFVGKMVGQSVAEMNNTNSHLSLFNDETDHTVVKLMIGGITGYLAGGSIQNNNLLRSNIDVMEKHIETSYCGGICGFVEGSEAASIKNCYVNCDIISNGVNSYCSSVASFVASPSEDYLIKNVLIDGSASSRVFSETNFISDISNSNILFDNCYKSSSYNSSFLNNEKLSETIEISDLSIARLKWEAKYWEISNGVVKFKVFE